MGTPRSRWNRTQSRLAALIIGVGLTGLVFAPAAGAAVADRPDDTYGTNGRVYTILEAGGRIYVGGTFSTAVAPGGGTVARKNLLALNAATGLLDPTFKPEANGAVYALANAGTTIYAGGKFGIIGGLKRKNLAAVDSASGAAVAGWKADADGKVEALVAGNSRVYAGGAFTAITDSGGTRPRYNLAAVSASNGTVDAGWNAAVAGDNPVRTVALSPDGNRLFFAGDFSQVAGRPRSHIAAVDAASAALDQVFAPKALPVTFGITADADRVYAAVGGPGGEVQAFDAVTGDKQWFVHGNGNFQSVALLNGLLYVGGHYGGDDSFGGQERYKLAAVNPANGAVSSFAPRVNSPLGVFEVQASGNHLYIGGDFTNVSGDSQSHFAQLTE
jgi:hypothetical protein